MLTHKPVNRYLASKDAERAGSAAPDGASPRRLRTPPRSVPSTIRLSCRLFVDVTKQCAASICSLTIEKYQYGCTFYEKKYSHTGILSCRKRSVIGNSSGSSTQIPCKNVHQVGFACTIGAEKSVDSLVVGKAYPFQSLDSSIISPYPAS